MTVWRVLKKHQVKAVVKQRKKTISDIVKKFLGKGFSWM